MKLSDLGVFLLLILVFWPWAFLLLDLAGWLLSDKWLLAETFGISYTKARTGILLCWPTVFIVFAGFR